MQINYTAPPVICKFMKSQGFFRIILGPVGSGKTTGCIFDLFAKAAGQAKAADGFRYTRFAIIRQTFEQLRMTVLKDILAWFGPAAEWKVSDKTVYISVGDIRSEWIFVPMDDPDDQRRLLSSQLTGAWLSESIELDVDLVSAIAGRCGRYPSGTRGVPTWFGMIADTNFPSLGSDWHKLLEISRPADWDVHKQPGGLSDGAENLEWLTQTEETLKLAADDPVRLAQGRKYYERLAQGANKDWVRRYVLAEYGEDPSGTAVFRESFTIKFHTVEEIAGPVVGQPLIVGQDFGRDPCSLICQSDHRGRLLVLQEVIASDMGLEMQLKMGLIPVLRSERYVGLPILVVGDPAGNAKSTLYEETSFDLIKRCGLNALPAPTNDIDPRLRAVETLLGGQVGGEAMLVIDAKRCPTLVRAMSGGYRYLKARDGRRKPTPDKNHPWSDVVDALQYVCLAVHGGMVTRFNGSRLAPSRQFKKVSARAWT